MSRDLKFHFDDGSASTPCFSLSGCVLVMKVMVKLVTQGLFKLFYFRNNKKKIFPADETKPADSNPDYFRLKPHSDFPDENKKEFTNFQSDCDQFSSEKSCDRLSRPK